MEALIRLLSQPSTQRGIIWILSGIAALLRPELAEGILASGAIGAGAVGVVSSDTPKVVEVKRQGSPYEG